jgi:hypothetical protein
MHNQFQDPLPALSMCFRLVNIIGLKSFPSWINSPWNPNHWGGHSSILENVKVIQEKATNELTHQVHWFLKYHDVSYAHAYFDKLADQLKFKVLSHHKKGVKRTISVEEAVTISPVIFAKVQPTGELQQMHFYSNQLLRSLIDYLLIKDGILNGLGIKSLDTVALTLLREKPRSFFQQGFIADLFVCDRIELFRNPDDVKFLSCYQDRLSTACLKSVEEIDGKEIFTL